MSTPHNLSPMPASNIRPEDYIYGPREGIHVPTPSQGQSSWTKAAANFTPQAGLK